MQIVNSQQLIEQIIKEHSYELGGKKWNLRSLTEQIKTGKISCLVREDENYFLYYNPRQKVALSTKPVKTAETSQIEAELLEHPKVSARAMSGIKVEESIDDNRIGIYFDTKPTAQIRTILKQNGFKYSPTNTAWQRILNQQGKSATQYVLKLIEKEMTVA